PKTGLIGQAHLKYHFKNQEAVIIGDSYRADMQCADNAGILGIHVATGRGSAGRQDVVGNYVDCTEESKLQRLPNLHIQHSSRQHPAGQHFR
ncbi:HAD hydrolase-like protein, partial [Lactiplantibacillus plantarum]|uniref:HAD hydrolase-like protein n=1 Tax=Lactiplantibacillus plantarum TaxID=1590 RepID=UPI00385386AF